MDFQMLISTMNQTDLSLIETNRICTNTLLINQADHSLQWEELVAGKRIRMVSFQERGLSRSRNRVLEMAEGEICHIADDDVVCRPDCEERILNAYGRYSDADLILFQVPPGYRERHRPYPSKARRIGYVGTMRIVSSEITFRRERILESGIRFLPEFGAGSGVYTLGEENIFLFDCLKQGLNIYYVPEVIGEYRDRPSSWDHRLNEAHLFARGAAFEAMSHRMAWLFVLQFAVRKYQRYRENFGWVQAVKILRNGVLDYRRRKAGREICGKES